jgi:hypothetical protein
MERQLVELHNRTRAAFAIKPRLRFGAISDCRTGEFEPWDSVGQLSRQHAPDRTQARYGNAGRHLFLRRIIASAGESFYAPTAGITRKRNVVSSPDLTSGSIEFCDVSRSK